VQDDPEQAEEQGGAASPRTAADAAGAGAGVWPANAQYGGPALAPAPFLLSVDLGAQLGKFVLATVDLPAALLMQGQQQHTALEFLHRKDDGLVL